MPSASKLPPGSSRDMTASPDLFNKLLPKFFGGNGLWSKSVRNSINSNVRLPPDTLWHYCSTSSFEGICRSSHLYLSDIESMNDYQEGRWLRDQIAKRVSGRSRGFLQYLDASRINFNLGPFITSLSENGDLLSQWRAYADGGRGLAVGISPERLSIPIFRLSTEQMPGYTALCNVVYDETAQTSIVKLIVDIIDQIVANVDESIPHGSSHPYVPCSAYVNLYLHYIEPIYKNPAFREEMEWRIVHFPKSALMDTWKDNSSVYITDEEEAQNLRFRTTNNDIVQYFTYPSDNGLSRSITKIALGPLNRMREQSLALFLRSCKINNFKFQRSEASLR